MTRKQALIRVCEVLGTYEQTEEIIELQAKMNEIMGELPFTAWSEATIFDTIDQWIVEHGRVPSTRDLARKGLPPVTVIKNRFGMQARKFLDTYYPQPEPLCDSSRYGYRTKAEWVADFIRQYHVIKPQSAVDYNRRREPDSPTWFTVASLCGLTKWNELLEYCKLDKPRRKQLTGRKPHASRFAVRRESDLDRVLAGL